MGKIINVKRMFIHIDSCHRMDLLCDLDLLFQGQIFKILISHKWWELAQIRDACIDFDICHRTAILKGCTRNGALRKLYSEILSYRFKVKYSECLNLCNSESWLKIVYYGFYRLRYLLSNSIISKVVFRDLDLLFLCQIFQMLISRIRWELLQECVICILKILFYRFLFYSLCLRSNDVIAKVLLREHDQLFSKSNISNELRVITKKCIMRLSYFNLLFNGTIVKVVLHDPDLHFEGQHCNSH